MTMLSFEMHIFYTDLLSAKLQHRTPLLTAQTVRFISTPLILSLSFQKDQLVYNMSFHTHHIVQCIPLLVRADKVPEVQYPQGLITK